MVADEDEYGAEELEEEAEEEAAIASTEVNGESSTAAVAVDGDAEMGGIEGAGEVVDEEEVSDDGSVDLENESEDDLEEEVEGEVEGEAAEGGDDAMELDEEKPAGKPAQEVLAH